MSIIMMNSVAFVSIAKFTVLNPAVLVVTDWKSEHIIWSCSPISLMVLFFSKAKNMTAPPNRRMAVTISAIFVCRDTFFLNLLYRIVFISWRRKKPSPPDIIKKIIVRFMTVSFWYLIRLSWNGENPALQKAAIE